MKVLFVAVLGVLLLTGCKTSAQLAKNLNSKNVSGNGLVTKSRIGLDEETQTPVIESLFISGDFKTIKSNSNFLDITTEESGSIFNAENKTKKVRVTITSKDNFAEVLKQTVELLKLQAENEN